VVMVVVVVVVVVVAVVVVDATSCYFTTHVEIRLVSVCVFLFFCVLEN
jgi:hypothetical protein